MAHPCAKAKAPRSQSEESDAPVLKKARSCGAAQPKRSRISVSFQHTHPCMSPYPATAEYSKCYS